MKRILIFAVAFAMLLVPAAASAQGWVTSRTHLDGEPNVPGWDEDDTRMHQGPNQAPVDQIYFDQILNLWFLPLVTVPQAPGSSVQPYGFAYPTAYLGSWRDCNGDGFIGSITTGKAIYPRVQAIAEAEQNDVNAEEICPQDDPTTDVNEGRYNDGTQVFEFIPIGPNIKDVTCAKFDEGPAGQDAKTPRPKDGEGMLDDPPNKVATGNDLCTGERQHFVQDDWAKAWYDWGLPTDAPGGSSLLLPFPDGTFRDSNGQFRYADRLFGGQLDANTPFVWPVDTSAQNADPAKGQQCDSHPEDGGFGAGTAGAYQQNVEDGMADGADCSPIPNIRYFDTPAGDVAWPGHLAEDRLNNSEDSRSEGTPFTAPFDKANGDNPEGTGFDDDGYEANGGEDSKEPLARGDCELKRDENGNPAHPDTWDDDPNDGDPFYGYSFNDDPTDFSAWYGPGEDGPSLWPTVKNVDAKVFYEIEKTEYAIAVALAGVTGDDPPSDDPECDQIGTFFVYNDNLENHAGDSGSDAGGKTSSSSQFAHNAEGAQPFMFYQFTFNPSTAPGGPANAVDTELCLIGVPLPSLNHEPLRCEYRWESQSVWIIHAGLLDINPTLDFTRTITSYADVSFGIPGEGENPSFLSDIRTFAASDGHVWDDGSADAPWSPGYAPITSAALPAGVNNKHIYGDEGCDDGITALSGTNDDSHALTGAGNIVGAGGLDENDNPQATPGWSCDRNAWELVAQYNGCSEDFVRSCYLQPFVGDRYDLRDVDCFDNDVLVDKPVQNIYSSRECENGLGSPPVEQ